MQIGYFTNQYPSVSHTFIRREIQALERRGHVVQRLAVRPSRTAVIDPADVAEARLAHYILEERTLVLLGCVARILFQAPLRSMRALMLMVNLAARNGNSYARHMAYLLEGIVLASWCRRFALEHLHVHFGTNPAVVALVAHAITEVPFSITVHGPEEFDRPEALSLSDKIAAAAFVVAVSSYGRSQLLRWVPMDCWKKIHVVHCGVGDDYLNAVSTAQGDDRRLVTVGRLAEQKGHFILLDAAAELRAHGIRFHLTIVGEGPLRGDIERRISQLGLDDCIELLGAATQDQVKEQLLRARALVLPSLAEGLPVVLMESMALGRPVLATFIAGIPELVTPDVGWLVPAGDAKSLARMLRHILTLDPHTLMVCGEAARHRIRERHDVREAAHLLEHLITTHQAQPASIGRGKDARNLAGKKWNVTLWRTKSLKR
ncbi:colanic acid biosynthesis glycosyltransferase WcaL [Pseudorhizobium halotolerans]|uniref:Colanic acid biosynthesis glycosyltransferase WcaL n=2 Tax=Pseudorhizobium halotolerans TaxID=1233081 RepID=A0ABM8PWN7_9HYPH|nr:colanic acid biosynthesis glycosyltransferase WcaL [Pseudorhizobium halotolerans]